MSGFKLTDEQCQAVDMAKKLASFKVSALAGTGKTTTLAQIAMSLKSKKGLYLSFNKGIAEEAQKKFVGSNCTARTFHSLAFSRFGKKYGDRLKQRLNSGYIRSQFNIHGDHAFLISEMAHGTLGRFLRTVDEKVTAKHSAWPDACVAYMNWKPDPEKSDVDNRQASIKNDIERKVCLKIQAAAIPLAQEIYNESIRPMSSFPVTHDLYLREFVISKPDLSGRGFAYDYVLFDEAQDADHLMLMLTTAQSLPVFYVGDAHQSIYAWRGAENAMRSLDLPETSLTTSFRFGSAVADDANLVLSSLGSELMLKGNPAKNSRVESNAVAPTGTRAIISRTNSDVVSEMLDAMDHGMRIGISGVSGIKAFLRDYKALEDGRPSGQFALFQSLNDLHEHAGTEGGSDLKTWIKLINDHGSGVLGEAVEHAVDLSKSKDTWKSCARIAITAHASKGMEFDSVHLSHDLFNPKRLEAEEERRLLYVAKTRAMSVLSQGGAFDWDAD